MGGLLMAGLDALARMRAQLLAERRGQMQRHPQQVAGAVGQGVDALAQFQKTLAAQDQAKAKAAALAAAKDADRRQREAQAAAALKQRAAQAAAAEAGRSLRAGDELAWKKDRFGQEQLDDPTRMSVMGKRVAGEVDAAPMPDDDMPEGDFDALTPDERRAEPGAFTPRQLLAEERYRQGLEDRDRKSRLDEATIRAKGRTGGARARTPEQIERQRVKDELTKARLDVTKKQLEERGVPKIATREGLNLNIAILENAATAKKLLARVPTGFLKFKAADLAGKGGMGAGGGVLVQDLKRSVGVMVQSAARKYEGGKLSDSDLGRYKDLLANLDTMTAAQIISALSDIERQVRNEHGRELSSVGKAKDVSEWADATPEESAPEPKKAKVYRVPRAHAARMAEEKGWRPVREDGDIVIMEAPGG